MKKKIIPILLAFVLVITLCPQVVFGLNRDGDLGYIVSGNRSYVVEYYGTGGDVIIPDTLGGYAVTHIDPGTFMNSNITGITMPDSINYVGFYAFSGCKDLSSIVMPSGVTEIMEQTFAGCTNLTSIELPEGLTTIGEEAFLSCTSLMNINIPESVASVGEKAFYNCSSLTSIEIPDGVTNIPPYLFYNCRNLSHAALPANCTSLFGGSVFYGCEKLDEVAIPNGVTEIGYEAFYGCSRLTSINIPDSVKGIEYGAFCNCSNLAQITIPEGVTRIEGSVFYSCTSLENMTLPVSVNYISTGVFAECSNLKSVTLSSNITNIPLATFRRCRSLENVNIPTGVTLIDQSAFEGCNKLNNIIIPEGITSIKDSTFKECSSLTELTIPDSITSIGKSAFQGCTSLMNLNLPDTVTSISDNAFTGCTSLITVEVPDGLTQIKAGLFQDCTNLASAILPEHTTRIYNDAFKNCINLKSISIPDSTTEIWNSAFENCKGLSNVTLPSGLQSISDRAFYGCESLASISIPASVTRLNTDCFGDCTNLASVFFYGNAPTVSATTFDRSNPKLTLYYLAESTGFYLLWQGFETHPFDPTILCTLSFDMNGSPGVPPLPQTRYKGMRPVKPDDPIYDGYVFGGWYSELTYTNHWTFTGNVVNRDTTLYAKWINPNECTVGFDTMDGYYDIPRMTVLKGSTFTAPPDPSRDGYLFSGWYKEPEYTHVWDINTDIVTGDMTLYAKWTPVYTVYFVSWEESSLLGSINAPCSTTVTEPANPQRTGYTFAGWYREPECTHEWIFDSDTITGHTWIYAKWAINNYSVTFDTQGGSRVDIKTALYDTVISEPLKPEKAGNVFAGWYKEPDCIHAWDFNWDAVKGDITLYAKWINNICTVTFDAQGGSGAGSLTVHYGDTINEPLPYPTKAGCSFNGWYRDAACTSWWHFGSDAVTSDMILYAKWFKIPYVFAGSYPTNKVPPKANAGSSMSIYPATHPAGYKVLSIGYTSNNPTVARMENNVIIFLTGGKATISMTAIFQGTDSKGRVITKTTTIRKTITVDQLASSIALNMTDKTILRTQTVKLKPSFDPTSASNKKVEWTSSNSKIASVSSAGVVTGKVAGTATIYCTAQDGSKAQASCEITVNPISPTNVKLSKTFLQIKLGKTGAVKATVLPVKTDFKKVTWTSSDPSIASVDSITGKIKGMAPGTVTITATTANGLGASCTVTIQ